VRRLTFLLLALAVVFLVWMLYEVGWANLWRHLVQVGWYWPLLLLPYGVVNWLEAVSWNYLLITDEGRPSFTRLFCLRLAGESLNQLTPTASMGGEPYKAFRLQAHGVPWEEATASVVIHKGILVLSLVLYVMLGIALAPLLLPVSSAYLGLLSLAAVGLGAAGLAFVVLQRQDPCVQAIRLLEKLGWCPQALKNKEEELSQLDAVLSRFYREHPKRGALAFGLFFASWLLHGVEVYLMFRLLGHPISWPLALCLDALAMLFAAVGFFIPAALGVQEGGNILLSLGFNLGAPLGAAFSILRRLREAFWLSLGLIVVAREK
jgi:uncharacterized protein (TIRG00374 family)